MTKLEEKGQAPSGNSEPAIVEENRTATDITSDKKDYSDKAFVYVISAARIGRGVLPKLELGKTERKVINTGARLAKGLRKTGTPLPLQCVVTANEKKIYYGPQFALERDITDTDNFRTLSDIVEDGTIQYIAVMCDDFFPFAYVLYGRYDRPEYFATVPVEVAS